MYTADKYAPIFIVTTTTLLHTSLRRYVSAWTIDQR